MTDERLAEIEEASLEFNEDCIIPKEIMLDIIASLRAEQVAHNKTINVLKCVFARLNFNDDRKWIADNIEQYLIDNRRGTE